MVNSFGRVVEVDTDEQAQTNFRIGMRKAEPAEIARYEAQLAEREVAADLARAGDSVYFSTVASSPDGYGMSRDLIKTEALQQGLLLSEQYAGQKVGLLYSYPTGVVQMESDVRIIYTMFESDKIPVDWPDYLELADEVLVPSRWMQDVMAKFGIESTVVPLGYNERVFGYIERQLPADNNQDFTFIHYNSFNIRKGFSEVLEAFATEFADHEPVKLILKTTMDMTPIPIPRSQYPNIEVIRGAVSERELTRILGRAHCMVYPSRGEGFGITPLEAMATGMPTIVPNEHGISEYFDARYMLEVKAPGRCPGLYNRFRGQDTGEMVIADVADLRRQMRYAFTHQKDMHELGKKASEYVKKYTYANTAKQLVEILKGWQTREVAHRPDVKILKADRL